VEKNFITDTNLDELFLDFVIENKIRSPESELRFYYVNDLWEKFTKTLNNKEFTQVTFTRKFAEAIKYTHSGLSPSEYFLHPLRVGIISGIANPSARVISSQIGLLHNIYEVSNMNSIEISKKFGKEIDYAISSLTINRKLQSNLNYLSDYYGVIASLPNKLGIVKVIDKLDNLFSLNNTASNEIKEKYLQEITNFVIPLCEFVSPPLSNLLKKVTHWIKLDNRKEQS
jgi:(p)ppGpp synthase/HD superfamily hydrolase